MSSEKLLRRAEAARKRATAASEAAHRTMDQIPMGQPLMPDHHSYSADRNRRDRAWDNIGKAAHAVDEAERLEHSAARVAYYEKRLINAQTAGAKVEGFEIGDRVIACFTNSGQSYRFHGVIVRRTVNDWKVQTTGDAPYGEAAGRVFTIPALGTRKYSANNRVYQDPDE